MEKPNTIKGGGGGLKAIMCIFRVREEYATYHIRWAWPDPLPIWAFERS